MHPYELQSVIKITHKDDFLQLKAGSLYNSINRLLKAGLIEVAEKTRAGRRPERTVYCINDQGRNELTQWLGELLENPVPDSLQFYAALSFLPVLKPREVLGHLQKRLGHLEAAIGQDKETLRLLAQKIGRLNLIEVEYRLALRTAERRWVGQIIEELKDETFAWDPETLRKHAAHFFDNCPSDNNSPC